MPPVGMIPAVISARQSVQRTDTCPYLGLLGSVALTSHQELAQKLDLLEPERLLAITVHKEVKSLTVAVPPLVRILAAAHVAAKHVPVPEEQGAETRGHADGVNENEDDYHHSVRLIRVGIAIDRVVGAVKGLILVWKQQGFASVKGRLRTESGHVKDSEGLVDADSPISWQAKERNVVRHRIV